MRAGLKIACVGAAALLVVFIAADFSGRDGDVPLSSGDHVHIKSASTWALVRGSYCRLTWQPKDGEVGTVDFWQDLVHGLIAIMPAANTNVILCLYEFDTDLRLIRVDATTRFRSLSLKNSTCLSATVCSPCWNVEEADIAEWRYALNYLKNSPARLLDRSVARLWPLRLSPSLYPILRRMEGQVKLMLDNGTKQWPVNTSVR
jgi:hypothetical protein